MESWNYKPARDLGMPIGQRLRSTRRESGLVGRFAQRVGQTAATAILRWLEKIEVVGAENIPAHPPLVMISNHSSHFDALALASIISPRLRSEVFPIAAGDTFFETPAHATLSVGLLNALPMWRKNCGRHAISELRSRLIEEPCGFILFPEGTRSRTGEMGTFKAGVGMIVAGTSVPVIPCYLHGAFAAWPPNSKWPKRGATIKVRVGKPLSFADGSDDGDGWKRIAGDLEKAVRKLAMKS